MSGATMGEDLSDYADIAGTSSGDSDDDRALKPFRTERARRLWELRSRVISSGAPLLEVEEVRRELEARRGERDDK